MVLKRLAALAVGAGVFVLIASVVEPVDSSAGPATVAAVRTARFDPYDAATRQIVQAKLLEHKHPKGWPSLGMLEGVEYYVLIHGSPQGPRYSIFGLDGRLLLADLPPDDVYRAFPTLDIEGMRLEPADLPDGPALMLADPVTRD